MALSNKSVAETSAETEYLTMCIGSARTCPALEQNFCVTHMYAGGYASVCLDCNTIIVSNPSSNGQYYVGTSLVLPKGCCVAGNCCTFFSGYFFGD